MCRAAEPSEEDVWHEGQELCNMPTRDWPDWVYALKALTSQYLVPLSLYEVSEAQTLACLIHNSMKNMHNICACASEQTVIITSGLLGPYPYTYIMSTYA